LRREVLGADDSLHHPYFRALDRQLTGYEQAVSHGDLVAAASLASVIYVGDFHAVPAYQTFAAGLLGSLALRVPELALGVEFVHSRQQHVLDRRQAGEIDDEEFLKRLHYREAWGYPWEGYRELLDGARTHGVPVHALDVGPRSGFAGLARRDEHAARRIAAILSRRPETRLMVVFGESHLARAHLPRRVKSRLKRVGRESREVVILQNPDRLYWKRVAADGDPPRVVRIDGNAYAVFHTSPLEKYEAYRQLLDRWRDDVPAGEEVDLTPAAHQLIGVLLGWLAIRPEITRVHHRAGWSEDLLDAYPEVYAGAEAGALLFPILKEHHRSGDELTEARSALRRRGAFYDPRANTMFLSRYLPGPVAGEAARFLRAALSGRLFIAADDFNGDPAARAYGAAYDEALAYLGARLVDPASDELVSRPLPAAGAGVTPAVDLGRRLGEVLFRRVRSGEIDRPTLAKLFRRPLYSGSAVGFVLQLLRG